MAGAKRPRNGRNSGKSLRSGYRRGELPGNGDFTGISRGFRGVYGAGSGALSPFVGGVPPPVMRK